MSGVEAAGFILAAFPLLISALENYRQGCEILEDWWKIKREYKKFQQTIKLQKLIFEENLEQLLSTLVHDDDELKGLIAEPGGQAWRDPELELGLKERLPRSYEFYLEYINEIVTIMESLKHELGIDMPAFQSVVACEETMSIAGSARYSSSVRVKFDMKPNFQYQKQRIKFTFNRTTRNKLLEELASYNSKLQRLLESSDRLAASRQTRNASKVQVVRNAGLLSFWRHAKTVYGLLKEAWRCNCLGFHHANLLLQHRTTPDVELTIFFVFSWNVSQRAKAPWKCRRTKIKQIIKEIALIVPSVPALPATTITSNNLPPRPALKSRPGRSDKSVKWEATEVPIEPVSTAIEVASSDVIDLCTTLGCCNLGRLNSSDHTYFIYPVADTEGGNTSLETVTLERVLSKNSPMKLTRRQRYSVALTIASSHLQLHDSPWLGPQWSKKDILFHSRDGNIILTEEPYISKGFLSQPSTPQPSYFLADHGLSTLGIILLELCFGVALEDHEIRRNFVSLDGQPNLGLDLVAAMQWCDRSANDEAGPEFAGAIEWCLRNATARQSGDTEQAWREELFNQVVEPLQYCHKQLVATVGGR